MTPFTYIVTEFVRVGAIFCIPIQICKCRRTYLHKYSFERSFFSKMQGLFSLFISFKQNLLEKRSCIYFTETWYNPYKTSPFFRHLEKTPQRHERYILQIHHFKVTSLHILNWFDLLAPITIVEYFPRLDALLKSGGVRWYRGHVKRRYEGIFNDLSSKKLGVHVHPLHPPFRCPWSCEFIVHTFFIYLKILCQRGTLWFVFLGCSIKSSLLTFSKVLYQTYPSISEESSKKIYENSSLFWNWYHIQLQIDHGITER